MRIDNAGHEHSPCRINFLIAQLRVECNLTINFSDTLILNMYITSKVEAFVNDARVFYKNMAPSYGLQ